MRNKLLFLLSWFLIFGKGMFAYQGIQPWHNSGQAQRVKGSSILNNIHLYTHLRLTLGEGEKPSYSLRRLKIYLSQELGRNIEFYIKGIFKEGNHSPTDGRPYLLDAYLRINLSEWASITVGQFKPSFGMERLTSDTVIYTINRSQAINRLIPNGMLGSSFTRDRGLQFSAQGLKRRLACYLALFDGNGANMSFRGNGPMCNLWVSLKPGLASRVGAEIQVALSYRRCRHLDFSRSLGGSSPFGYQCFHGSDVRYDLAAALSYRGFSWKMEYLQAWFNATSLCFRDITAAGYFLEGAYRLTPKLQVAMKYEVFDPDQQIINPFDICWKTLGLNYYIKDNRLKTMVDYIIKDEKVNPMDNNEFLLQFQYLIK